LWWWPLLFKTYYIKLYTIHRGFAPEGNYALVQDSLGSAYEALAEAGEDGKVSLVNHTRAMGAYGLASKAYRCVGDVAKADALPEITTEVIGGCIRIISSGGVGDLVLEIGSDTTPQSSSQQRCPDNQPSSDIWVV
jgi:hypothetical protein